MQSLMVGIRVRNFQAIEAEQIASNPTFLLRTSHCTPSSTSRTDRSSVLIANVVTVICQSYHGCKDSRSDNTAAMLAIKKKNHLDLGSARVGLTRL